MLLSPERRNLLSGARKRERQGLSPPWICSPPPPQQVAAGLEGAALEHVRAARTLRHEADLEDVTAGLLENDEWQAGFSRLRARKASRSARTLSCRPVMLVA